MKLAFTPISIAGGLLAGFLATKVFEQVWSRVAGAEPPDAKHRELDYPKLAAALLVEGALFRLFKGFADHGMRQAFARGVGTWPGEEEPDSE